MLRRRAGNVSSHWNTAAGLVNTSMRSGLLSRLNKHTSNSELRLELVAVEHL